MPPGRQPAHDANPPSPLTAAAGFLDDPEVQDAVKELTLQALRHAAWVLRYGDQAAKNAIMRSLLPALARTIRPSEENDEIAKMRAEMQAMVTSMRHA